jgi:hypothetical protein
MNKRKIPDDPRDDEEAAQRLALHKREKGVLLFTLTDDTGGVCLALKRVGKHWENTHDIPCIARVFGFAFDASVKYYKRSRDAFPTLRWTRMC